MEPLSVGRPHVDPHEHRAHQVPDLERRLVGFGQPFGKGEPFAVFQAVGENAGTQKLLILGRVPRDAQVE
jgi:hypothetical protein